MGKLIFALLTLGACGPVFADEITLPGFPVQVTGPAPDVPHKGQTMQAVASRYGTPLTKHAPVGGETPRHPPITRWDYADFSVFFEHTHVVDAVVPSHPAPVYNTEQLESAQ